MSAELITPSDLAGEADAYQLLERLRWGDDGPEHCPHCGSGKGAWYLQPKDPEGRKSKGGTSAKSQRRVWKCRESNCRRQFSVLTNTVMHGTKMPVQVWLEVVYALCATDDGLSARDIAARWGVAEKSALLMLTRIQHALERPEVAGASLAGNAPLWVRVQASPVTPAAVVESPGEPVAESRAEVPVEPVAESRAEVPVEPLGEPVAVRRAEVPGEPVTESPAAPAAESSSVAPESEPELTEAEARKAAQVKADVARALAEALGETASAPPVISRTLRTGPTTPADLAHPDADKPDKSDKPDKPENPDKPEKPEKPEKPDKPDKPEKSDKPKSKSSGSKKQRRRRRKAAKAKKARLDQKQVEVDVQRALLDDSLGPSWASDDEPAPLVVPDQLGLFDEHDDPEPGDAT